MAAKAKTKPKASKPKSTAKRKSPSKSKARPATKKPKQVSFWPTPRLIDDVEEGHFATVVEGEYKGRYGVFEGVSKFGKDSYPETVLFRTRDDDSLLIALPYKSLRRADPGGR